MNKWNFHLPEGFTDTMPAQCAAKRSMEQCLRELFSIHRYREVETPGMEFLDVYTCGEGFAAPEQLFKSFDQQGRILTARFDGTIPVARMAATKFPNESLPLRLSYIENMYRFSESGGGRQKGFTQAGVELLGSDSPPADGEVIALAIKAAEKVGLTQIQVGVGQVEFFRGLAEEWELNTEQELHLMKCIDSKELIAIEQFVEEAGLPDNASEVLALMLYGDGRIEQLSEYRALVKNERSLAALDNLQQVLDFLGDLNLLSYISVDLGLLQSLDYYTGIIFKGFTYAIGSPLFSGGRYDRVVSAFGRDLPATGFSMGIDYALTAIQRQNLAEPNRPKFSVVCYADKQRKAALSAAEELRRKGRASELHLAPCSKEQAMKWAKERGAGELIYIEDDGSLYRSNPV